MLDINKKRLGKEFYLQDTSVVAQELLGKYLYKNTEFGLIAGKIVETEAYLSEDDPACHAYIQKTKRNWTMFEEGGMSYVYLIYGFYFCFNVVTGLKDKGEAVLIRGIEPIQGLDIMRNYRHTLKEKDLTNGPGKLCLAMNINIEDNGKDLINGDSLYLSEGETVDKKDIFTTTRIGITKGIDLPLRFYIKNNQYVSKLAKGDKLIKNK